MARVELLLVPLLLLSRGDPPWKAHPLAWAEANLAAPDRRVREGARRYLAFRAKEARPFLLRALEDPNWRAREGALQVLAWSGTSLPRKAEESLARDPSWPVRRALACYLGSRREGAGLLRDLAGDAFRDVRAQALLGLAALGALEPERIQGALESRAEEVRRAALRVLVYDSEQITLPRAPGRKGGGLRRRALRALALGPLPGRFPWLEGLLRPGPGEGTLEEKLLALQILRPLGSARPEDKELVLKGLASADPRARGAAVGAGLLLGPEEVEAILPRGLRLPGREGFEGFLEISGRRARALAPLFVPELEKLLRERSFLLAGARWFLRGAGLAPGPAEKKLLEDLAEETLARIERTAALAGRAGAPGLETWLLRVLAGPADADVRDRLLPYLLPFAGKPEVRKLLLSLLPALPWWRRRGVVEALVKAAGGKPLPLLLLPLRKGEIRGPRALADYLEGLRGYPPTPVFRALLRRMILEEKDTRVRDRAARDLVRSPRALTSEDLEALEKAILRKDSASGLRWICLEALASRGDWDAAARILKVLPPKEALVLERNLARFIRRSKAARGIPFVRKWALEGKDRRLELEAFLALAALGEKEAWEGLLDLSLTAGELEADRIVQAFLDAPDRWVEKAFETWSPTSRPPYLREGAFRLAGERDAVSQEALEKAFFLPGPSRVKGAALAALISRKNWMLTALVEKLLFYLLYGPDPERYFGDSPEEALQQVLPALSRARPPFAERFLWAALLKPFFEEPLKNLQLEEGDAWARRGRSLMTEARIYAEVLFSFPEERLRKALEGALAREGQSLGRGLLGKTFLLNLLYELHRNPRVRAMPGLARELAELILQLAPRGGMPDFYALVYLARRAELKRRWNEAASLFERARREALLGGISLREVEMVLGETDPPGRSFPLLRLALRPRLLRAWKDIQGGREKEGLALARRVLALGRADGPTCRVAREILDSRGKDK